MVLVDTSIWINHFKGVKTELTPLLLNGQVLTHDFVLGELSLGHFRVKDRRKIFDRLHALDKVSTSSHEDVMEFSIRHRLSGQGIGWIDCHLIHSCFSNKIPLLSLDKKLNRIVSRLA